MFSQLVFLLALIFAIQAKNYHHPKLHKSVPTANINADKDTIADRLHNDIRFSKLSEILSETKGLRDNLGDAGLPMTLFAPTDDAFEELKHLPNFGWDNSEIVAYHTVQGSVSDKDFREGQLLDSQLILETLKGGNQILKLVEHEDRWSVNFYAEVKETIKVRNGHIHLVNRVILPPPTIFQGLYMIPTQFSMFTSAAQHAHVDTALDKDKAISVFIVPNRAWERLGSRNLAHLFSPNGAQDLEKILRYHMVDSLFYSRELGDKKSELTLHTFLKGESLHLKASRTRDKLQISINKNTVITVTDVAAENGVVHIVDSVLIPSGVHLPEKV